MIPRSAESVGRCVFTFAIDRASIGSVKRDNKKLVMALPAIFHLTMIEHGSRGAFEAPHQVRRRGKPGSPLRYLLHHCMYPRQNTQGASFKGGLFFQVVAIALIMASSFTHDVRMNT